MTVFVAAAVVVALLRYPSEIFEVSNSTVTTISGLALVISILLAPLGLNLLLLVVFLKKRTRKGAVLAQR